MSTKAQERQTIRCFIALTIPQKIQERLADIQHELKRQGAKARWVKPKNIHMTLRFLGNRHPKRVQEIAAMLPDILDQNPNFKITVDALNAFPNIEYPKILWAEISDGSDETIKLFDTLNNGLAKLGIPKDRELFIPHFTIGRCKTSDETWSCAAAIKKAPMFSIEAKTQSVTFYQSTLSSSEPIYQPIYQKGDSDLFPI